MKLAKEKIDPIIKRIFQIIRAWKHLTYLDPLFQKSLSIK